MTSFRSILSRTLQIFSGLKLATACFIVLFILTWLGTLEQVDHGLYQTTKKYFSSENFLVLPEINGKMIPLPLPSAYWVSVVLFINLLIGGVIRARKGWKKVGVLMSHCGMLFLLVGGFITHHFSERGNMQVWEGETSNVAKHYFNYVIEITELVAGEIKEIHVIDHEYLEVLKPDQHQFFKLEQLPFDLEVAGYQKNSVARQAINRAPRFGERIVDGFYLEQEDSELEAETNIAGCYARLVEKDSTKGELFILWGGSAYMQPKVQKTIQHGERTFLVDLVKERWVLPNKIKLNDMKAEFYPGTINPKTFESRVTRTQEGVSEDVLIKMNQPMRRDGFTYFQAQWGPQGSDGTGKLFSVFEIVKNPADQWPKYALYVSGVGLSIHFALMLGAFIMNQFKRRNV